MANDSGRDYQLLLGDDELDALLSVHLVVVEQRDLVGELVLVGFILRILGHPVLKHCDYGHINHHSTILIIVSFHPC